MSQPARPRRCVSSAPSRERRRGVVNTSHRHAWESPMSGRGSLRFQCAGDGPGRVIHVHGRQVPDLVLGEVESIPSSVPVTAPIGMATSLRPRQVPFLEEHMGHVVVAGIDDEPFDMSDRAVDGLDAVAAAHRYLAEGEGVIGDGLQDPGEISPSTDSIRRGLSTARQVLVRGRRPHNLWCPARTASPRR